MALEFDRLKEGMVITTDKPIRQPDGRFKYPILIVEKIIQNEREITVRDTDTKERKLLSEEDFQKYYPAGVSLWHKDRIIRELLQKSRKDQSFKLLVEICQRTEDPELLAYISEKERFDANVIGGIINRLAEVLRKDSDLKKEAKVLLQENLEREVKPHHGMFIFKQQGVADRKGGE